MGRRWLSQLVLLFSACAKVLYAFATEEEVWTIAGVHGTKTSLPCPLKPRMIGDRPKLILWYKNGTKTPIFSYDERSSSYKSNLYRENGQLKLDPKLYSAHLTITSLAIDDVGIYECRVDFFQSPTHSNLVNLTVIVPPYSAEIFDNKRGSADNGVLGPYQEGEGDIKLTCLVRGGSPTPNTTWWSGGRILNRTSGPIDEGVSSNTVQSDLFLPTLSREWHSKTITCSSTNSELTEPVQASVQLNMHLLPTSVIVSYEKPVRENQRLKLHCITRGSKPPADLTWTIGGKQFPQKSQRTTKGERVTSSTITINVTKESNGREVVCKASNPNIPNSFLHNSTLLDIHYPPTANAILGASLKPDLLKEGDDVYFVCEVDSNPPSTDVKWFHEQRRVEQNISQGILLAVNSLVLQGVNRSQAGRYHCSASNYLGNDTSSPVKLNLRYKPECSTSPTTYFIYDRPINVSCKVSSHPPAVRMHWRWEGGSDILNIRPMNAALEKTTHPVSLPNNAASGTLTVNPAKNSEDRELSCWAFNEMGSQTVPCSFSIKVAKIPEPLSSCRLANITASSLSLSCKQPNMASTDSTFYRAELYLNNHTLFANVTSNEPHFKVSRLDPGTNYSIKVYVSRGPVTSIPVVVSASTFRNSRVEASTSGALRVSSTLELLLLLNTFLCLVPWKKKRNRDRAQEAHELSVTQS